VIDERREVEARTGNDGGSHKEDDNKERSHA
jgi:hypothetical protein